MQGVVGAVQAGAGLVQAVAGVVDAGASILAAPETLGGSLLALPGGLANATYGASAILDGSQLMMAAWNGSGGPSTTFGSIGQQYGGQLGSQAGQTIGALGGIILAAQQPTTSRLATVGIAIASLAAGEICN